MLNLSEAITYKQINMDRRNHGTFIALAAGAYFRKQLLALGARLDELDATNSDAIFDATAQHADKSRLERSIIMAYLGGLLWSKRTYALERNYDTSDIHVLLYQQQHIPTLITQLNDTSKQEIRNVITVGINADIGLPAIRKSVKQLLVSYETSRAALVGSYESLRAFNLGMYSAIVDTGVPYEKQWLTAGDDRVEQECEDNRAQGWVALSVVYNDGLQCPPAHVGCRCAMNYRKA
jgi:hypothetical protein